MDGSPAWYGREQHHSYAGRGPHSRYRTGPLFLAREHLGVVPRGLDRRSRVHTGRAAPAAPAPVAHRRVRVLRRVAHHRARRAPPRVAGRWQRSSSSHSARWTRGRAGSGSRSPSRRGAGCATIVAAARQTDVDLRRRVRRRPRRRMGRRARPDVETRTDTVRVAARRCSRSDSKRHGVSRVRRIQYGDDERNRRHRLDVYKRADAGPGAPVLLQIHGGAWVIGNKDQQGLPADVPPRRARLGVRRDQLPAVSAGDVARPDPRLQARASRGSAPTSPSTAAIPTTSSSPAVRPADTSPRCWRSPPTTRSSSPGSRTSTRRVRAMVPFYGVYDWTNRFGQRGRRDGLRRMLERAVVKQRYADAPEVFEQASPMQHVHADAPPALVVHGDLDTLAPVAEAREFVRMLREVSRQPVVYAELRGAHARVRDLPVDPRRSKPSRPSICSSPGCSPSTLPARSFHSTTDR